MTLFIYAQTPLHLDIPYVAASPASHSNTLASIERFDTPRTPILGPASEAGKAVIAARKHSMRQEHLAAIANLNTFAKKRASKSPVSLSGSANTAQFVHSHFADFIGASSSSSFSAMLHDTFELVSKAARDQFSEVCRL